jgi:hypothetical protein
MAPSGNSRSCARLPPGEANPAAKKSEAGRNCLGSLLSSQRRHNKRREGEANPSKQSATDCGKPKQAGCEELAAHDSGSPHASSGGRADIVGKVACRLAERFPDAVNGRSESIRRTPHPSTGMTCIADCSSIKSLVRTPALGMRLGSVGEISPGDLHRDNTVHDCRCRGCPPLHDGLEPDAARCLKCVLEHADRTLSSAADIGSHVAAIEDQLGDRRARQRRRYSR